MTHLRSQLIFSVHLLFDLLIMFNLLLDVLLGQGWVVLEVRETSIESVHLLLSHEFGDDLNHWEFVINHRVGLLYHKSILSVPGGAFEPYAVHICHIRPCWAIVWSGVHYIQHFERVLYHTGWDQFFSRLLLSKSIQKLQWIEESWSPYRWNIAIDA